MADGAPRTPLLVTCQRCRHTWPILWMPCTMAAAAKFSRERTCPWCGSTNQPIATADRAAGDLDRYVAWLETELARARKDAADG